MSETTILIGSNPDQPQVVGAVNFQATAEEKGKLLPKPSGYHILCAIPEQEKEYESGIIKSDTTLHMEEVLSTVFFVVDLGPDCYKDEKRFPSGPWCKKGDFILARPNTGTRLKIHGREFRIINDDSVEGIVDDPRGISRV
jgi:co-chaperonin GroES (HSP10)